MLANDQFNSSHSPIELNPSLQGGYSLLYDNTIPIDMKYIDYDRNVNHLGNAEIVNFKIYTFGMKPNIFKVKIEIDSENDPFFIATFECDENIFGLIKNQQKLSIGFQDLPTIIIKCLNKVEQAKGKLNVGLLVHSDGKSKLSLSHTSQFKNIEILTLELNQQTQERLEEIIKFKYSQLRKKIMKAQERLIKINEVIKDKNPSLLTQIFKTHK